MRPDQGLREAQTEINKIFGEGTLLSLDDDYKAQVDVVSTGSKGLDEALGVDGIPRGRIVEIFGPDGSGKTTLTYEILSQVKGGCALIDTEHSFDTKYAKAIGVRTENLYFTQPFCGEDALQTVDKLIDQEKWEVIAVDSVAALTPRAELEGQVGDSVVGGLARLMSQAMRMFAGKLSRTNTALVFTNQIRERIASWGPTETQPGGRALKFYASQRIDLRKVETLKQGDEAYGIKVKARVVKNKVAAPFKEAVLTIVFGQGISEEAAALDRGLKDGRFKQSGAWFDLGGARVQGRLAAIRHLRVV